MKLALLGLAVASVFGQITPHQGPVRPCRVITLSAQLTAEGCSPSRLLQVAYAIEPYQISGDLPGALYDVAVPAAELPEALAQRFQLKFHREKRELAVYDLVVREGVPNFKASASGAKLDVQLESTGHENSVTLMQATIADLIRQLAVVIGDQPLFDKTALTGVYDMRFSYTPEHKLSGGPEDVSIFTAIEGLGLKLVERKAEVEMLVVDRIVKP